MRECWLRESSADFRLKAGDKRDADRERRGGADRGRRGPGQQDFVHFGADRTIAGNVVEDGSNTAAVTGFEACSSGRRIGSGATTSFCGAPRAENIYQKTCVLEQTWLEAPAV